MDVMEKRAGRPISKKYEKLHNLVPKLRKGESTVMIIDGDDRLRRKYNAMQIAYRIADKYGVRVSCRSMRDGIMITRIA